MGNHPSPFCKLIKGFDHASIYKVIIVKIRAFAKG
jgi:hypothetical protein